MAKRTPRSQADDATAETPTRPPTRRGRSKSSRNTGEPTAQQSPSTSDYLGLEPQPNEDEIRHRAYHLYLERGGGHGRDFDDWVRAEKELKKQSSKKTGNDPEQT